MKSVIASIWISIIFFPFDGLKGQTISGAEYFVDTDPGVGQATSLTVSIPGNPVTFTQTISTAGIKPGVHLLFVRTKSSDGLWSLSEPRSFSIEPAIDRVEYFFDTDPGTDHGISLASGTPASFTQAIPTTGLAPGYHILFVRTRSNDGRWSLYQPRDFVIESITGAEYFVDNDPGTGSGTPLPFTPGLVTLSATVPTASLKDGQHFLFVRTRHESGRWSLSDPKPFYIRTRITQVEYFIDTDPGFGSGIPLTVAVPSDLITITPSFATSPLSDGDHYLFVRTMDKLGNWSLYEPQLFHVDSALPIELLAFAAAPVGENKVKVQWSTATEINNDFFTVQHSTDGMEYAEIDTIKAAGNSTLMHSYEMIHRNPASGKNYYRLKQTDYNGIFTFSKIVVVEMPAWGEPVIYPNPALGEWHIAFADSGDVQLIEVFDLVGRKCMEAQTQGESLVTLPRGDLTSGTYVVRIASLTGKTTVHRIVMR